MNALLLNRIITSICAIAFALSFVLMPIFAHADFNQEINYQGKLTDSSGLAVSDGTYNMYFWLVASSTAASSTSVWSEVRTGVDKVQVTNGLFSVMLGEVTSLSGVDFNQTLYLGVEIGGTGSSPTWDGEMSPRKVLGAVPASFVAESANTFAGLATTSFLRADEIDTMQATSSSALLTLIQNGAGKIMSLFSGVTEMFTVLNNGNVGIATTTPSHKLTVSGATNITGNLQVDDDSLFVDATNNRVGIGTTTPIGRLEIFNNTNGGNVSYLSNLNTGTGAYSEFNIRNASTTDTFGDGLRLLTMGTGWSTVGAFVQDGTALMSGANLSGGMSLVTLNASANMRFYTGGLNDANERMRITSAGYVGIGTTTPSVALTVSGNISVYDRLTLNDTDSNSALGYQAGKNVVSGAQYNTFLGYQAGFSSSTASTGIADNNTAIGALSLYSKKNYPACLHRG
ncbi:MAG: hypothetical protein UZ19_OD1000261 [Parcubacteria bacterium OLB19]|nr:MAG: hypothetical protein UZ19_OD1000261 [Parcubacteria bacterium OLB19]